MPCPPLPTSIRYCLGAKLRASSEGSNSIRPRSARSTSLWSLSKAEATGALFAAACPRLPSGRARMALQRAPRGKPQRGPKGLYGGG